MQYLPCGYGRDCKHGRKCTRAHSNPPQAEIAYWNFLQPLGPPSRRRRAANEKRATTKDWTSSMVYECHICGVRMNSKAQRIQHESGNKHRAQVAASQGLARAATGELAGFHPPAISHFQITQEEGLYSFEGAAFGSIRELLDHHVKTKEVITQKSQAVIINGAKRTERPYSHDDVKQGKRLSKGNFGDVYQGELIKDGTQCAIKICKESVPNQYSNPERFLEEADTLNQYLHPNIVQIYGVVKRAPIWIVLELCTGGELLVYLRKQGVTIGIAEKTRWAYEAASGIAYLHTRNCIHRDLAARNCLLDGGDPNTLKIAGASRALAGA